MSTERKIRVLFCSVRKMRDQFIEKRKEYWRFSVFCLSNDERDQFIRKRRKILMRLKKRILEFANKHLCLNSIRGRLDFSVFCA